MSESERTPESGGKKALEDIQPDHGALVGPTGPPVSLSPQINPFWSESAREEAILRACRPAHLPREGQDTIPCQATTTSPPREPHEAFRAMVGGLLQENARLWTEREAFANQGAWRQHPSAYSAQQTWLGNVMGDGVNQERNMMQAMMEVMKSSVGSVMSPKDRGLLGALANPVEHGGSGLFPRHDSGFFARHDPGVPAGHGPMHRGSLMEFFNMVSSAGFLGSMPGHGGMDYGRSMTGPSGGFAQEQTSRSLTQGASEEGPVQPVSQVSSGAETQAGPGLQARYPGASSEGASGHGGSGVPPGEPYRQGDGASKGGWQPSGSGGPNGQGDAPSGGPLGHGGPPGGFPGGGGPPGGFPGGGGPPWYGGFPHGFPGAPGGPPGGGGGGFPGGPPGNGAGGAYGPMPAWLGGLMAQQESIRAVDLPALPELSESEVGPLVAGDWMTTIGPFLRDMSSSSSLWWDEVLRVAGALYRV